jgi:hypothetical protein
MSLYRWPFGAQVWMRLRLIKTCACTETRFRLSPKRRVHLNRRGSSVQSTTGSRGVRISVSNAGYTMFRGGVKSTGHPLHSPVYLHFTSSASPCAITFQLASTTVEFIFYHIIQTTDSDDFPTQLSPIGLYNVNPPCSLWGVNCVVICTWCRLILMIERMFKTLAQIQSQGPINPKAWK